jgi:hypothetical protein
MGEGSELEIRCSIKDMGETKKMPAELKVSIGEIPQLILVNGYWNSILHKLGISPGAGAKKYWEFFLGTVNTFVTETEKYYGIKVKNNLPFYFDGSSFAGFTSGGKQRKKDGYSRAEKLFSHLADKPDKQPVCIVSHSEGGAYACGIAEYLHSIGYPIKENLLLHCDEADEFEVSPRIPTCQLNAVYFTKDAGILKKIADYAGFWYHSQPIRKIGDYYAVVDWMVGDYRLKGAQKYGIMIVDEKDTGWDKIHTHLVDNKMFDWLDDLKSIILYDVTGIYNGKAYSGKDHTIENYKTKFYRVDDHYIIPNYPK